MAVLPARFRLQSSAILGIALLALISPSISADVRVNPDAKLVADFENRVDGYMKIHGQVASEVPLRPSSSPEQIAARVKEFGDRIRALRADAKQGDIFSPDIATEFRRLLGLAMQGHRAGRVRASLRHAEPVNPPLVINGRYPSNIPRQSVPPTLLLNLPRLPRGVEYLIAGHQLALRDVDANLVVDFVPDAIP